MDAENNKDNKNELLTNWSKWLITINMFSATGCIVSLKTAGESAAKTGVFFFIAILCFCLSIVCSTQFVFLTAKKGLQKSKTDTKNHIWLAKLQWLLFVIGLMFVVIWIGFLSKVF